MSAGTLEAVVVRVNLNTILVPVGQPIPDGGVLLRRASSEEVYRVFYEATHCPAGHLRRRDRGGKDRHSCEYRSLDPTDIEWTWGQPA
jgi:hypothetical protein